MLPGVRRFLQESHRANRCKDGQLRIAVVLNELGKFGYRVFHNLRHDGHHFDHVIVGPTGVFAIETRPRSDAKTESQDCEELSRGNSGFDGWIRPLVVIAGEWRVKNDLQTTGVRLFTIDNLLDCITNQRSQFAPTEIQLIASHLERSRKLTVRFKSKSPRNEE